MARDWDKKIKEWDSLIRGGKAKLVEADLRRVKSTEVPRRFMRKVSSLARRANFAEFGIRILNPIVRPSHKTPSTASSKEKVEYAACLGKVGAIAEANILFGEVAEADASEMLLLRTYSLFPDWKYEEAIPYLEKYVRLREIPIYSLLVARLNLGVSYAFVQRWDEAERVVNSVLKEAEPSNFTLLLTNAFEILATVFMEKRDWFSAEEALKSAERLVVNSSETQKLFIQKWQAVLGLKKRGPGALELKKLEQVKEWAQKISHWETIRDCDKHRAILASDCDTFFRVYFGTPHLAYRKKLEAEFKQRVLIPESYWWRLGEGTNSSSFSFRSGRSEGKAALRSSDLLYKLFCALSMDHYRPARIVTLNQSLYPGEFYNPVSSPLKVKQIIGRFRKWTKEVRLPIKIKEQREWYSLEANGKCVQIEVLKDFKFQSREELNFNKLFEAVQVSPFGSQEVMKALGVSNSTALRLLKAAVDRGELNRHGQGPATRYTLKAKKRVG